ncbi:transposase [Streptomyces sp. NPDC005251]|uniref:transposase n=1 Tax=Streptomyces sp. NPDC005251 TaxID=3157166 RepID=UPI0033B99BB4
MVVRTGRPHWSSALVVRTGIPWRDIPTKYGPWSRVYDLFRVGDGTAPGIGSSQHRRHRSTRGT